MFKPLPPGKSLQVTDRDQDAAEVMNLAYWLLVMTALLVVGGLTMLYSASFNTAGLKFFRNQLIWVGAGVFGGTMAFLIGFRKLASASAIWIVLSFLLLMTALCFPAVNGANRWIRLQLPGLEMSLQPSEFAKIAVALFVAKYCTDNMRSFNKLTFRRGIFTLAGGTGMVILGILAGRDLGTSVLVGSMATLTMLVAGLWKRYIVIPVSLAGLIGTYIFFYDPVRLARVTSFLRPEEMQSTTGYQLWNSLLAFGSGGWAGIGFMESRLKAKYLPEAHTDFILAIVGEELGLIAILVVIAAYAVFAVCALKISLRSYSRLGMLLGFALTLGIELQAAINMMVVSGVAPTKGMPAPFISYGGSNMMATLIAVGILVSIAADTAEPGYNERYLNLLQRKLSFLPWFRQYRN